MRCRSPRSVLPSAWHVAMLLAALATASCGAAAEDRESPGSSAGDLPRTLAPVTPESVGISSERLERLEAGMQRFVDERELAGVVTLLARHGRVAHLSATGSKNIDTGDPMTTDAIFRIYSMSKPVTGVAMMILHEEGKWRLDDPVSNYLPEFEHLTVQVDDHTGQPRREDADRPMTMRELMTHSGGLAYGFSDSPADTRYSEANLFDLSLPLQGMIERLATLPLMAQPGTKWNYSISVDVQGYLVEKLSGQPFSEFLRERVFEPLGMTDTGFFVPPTKVDRIASVHAGENGQLETLSEMPYALVGPDPTERPVKPLGGAGLYSTIRDYARFAQMMLDGGALDGTRVLAPRTVEMMRTNHLSVSATRSMAEQRPGHGFGLDFAVIDDAAATGYPWVEGTFYWGGALGTWFWIDPATDLVFVGMIQHQGSAIGAVQGLSRNLVYQAVVE
jgi:CubicO group peptidase (beta-lactamase class C family)